MQTQQTTHTCPHCGGECTNGLAICEHCGANRLRKPAKRPIQTTHTRGPWQAVWPLDNLDITEIRTVEDEQQGHIATLGVSFDPEQTQANARLIAAAPDLLAALKDMIGDYRQCGMDGRQVVSEARAAIAKAEGTE